MDLARSAINNPDWFKSGWKKVSDRTLFYPGKASRHCYLFWWNAGKGTFRLHEMVSFICSPRIGPCKTFTASDGDMGWYANF